MRKPVPLPLNDGRASLDGTLDRMSALKERTLGALTPRERQVLELGQNRAHLARLGLPVILAAFALLCGCPPAPPPKAPPTVDASDAAAVVDGPTTPCQAAWSALDAIHCTVPYSLLAKIDGNRGFELAPDGAPLTCQGIAEVKTVQDAIALGIPCGEGGR